MRKAAKVVVVVFDGLRPDMVTPERMPRLASFSARSLWFREARSVFPSMTRVATTSVATGAPPAVHGIVGNAFLYPEVTPDFVLDTSRAEDLVLAEQRLGRALPTAETFADRLATAGLSLAIVHTGSAGSAYMLNPRAAAHGHWTFTILGEDATRTPNAVREAVEHFGPLPPRALPRFAEIDYAERVFREHVLATMAPDVALIWFNEPDTSSHYRFIGSLETAASSPMPMPPSAESSTPSRRSGRIGNRDHRRIGSRPDRGYGRDRAGPAADGGRASCRHGLATASQWRGRGPDRRQHG